jgi:tRNA(Ile2) C34 agmatinyltransferase TiaS
MKKLICSECGGKIIKSKKNNSETFKCIKCKKEIPSDKYNSEIINMGDVINLFDGVIFD